SPNWTYWPHKTVSALLNCARLFSVCGVKFASSEIRRSVRICATRSPGTVLNAADRPTSVRSMLAREGPSQSSDALPDAFRDGTINSDAHHTGADVVVGAGRPVRRSRNTTTPAPTASTTATAAVARQG